MSKTSTDPYGDDMTPAIATCLKAIVPHVDTILAMLSVGHTRTAAAKAVGVKPWYFFAILREGKIVKGRCHDILKSLRSGTRLTSRCSRSATCLRSGPRS